MLFRPWDRRLAITLGKELYSETPDTMELA